MTKLTCLVVFLLFVAHQGFASSTNPLPFQIGEKLEYNLSWGFIPVGTAVLEVQSPPNLNDEEYLQVKFSVRTNSFADAFYKVRTTIESTVKSDFSKSIVYRKSQEEGSTKKQIVVKFDYDQNKAVYTEAGKVRSQIPIPNQVFDPLSIAYFFRLQQLLPNQKTVLPTCDGKSFREIIVRTAKKKKISVPAGKYYAIETIPEMQNLRGVFKKSPDGILRVWYSLDELRLPVKISSKVVVGSFKAELTKSSRGK
jgi:hypothetical protein